MPKQAETKQTRENVPKHAKTQQNMPTKTCRQRVMKGSEQSSAISAWPKPSTHNKG
jgi:hypothetical protein